MSKIETKLEELEDLHSDAVFALRKIDGNGCNSRHCITRPAIDTRQTVESPCICTARPEVRVILGQFFLNVRDILHPEN